MELDVLTAISPIDGRYRGKTKALAAYFSEFALIKYRVQVEVEYFITLCELPLPQLKGIDSSVFETLRNIYRNFSEADAQRIKDIESVTNHDVKAQMVSSRSKKRFLYFISSYAYNKKQKSQCANFLNPGISTLAIQKGMSTLFYLNNQVSGYTPEFSRISNLQCQLAFVIFYQFIRTGRMSSQ